MAKLSERISALSKGLGESLSRFPLEAALGFTYFIIWVLADSKTIVLPSGSGYENLAFWFFPHVVLLFFLHRLSAAHPWAKVPYFLSWLLWLPLVLVSKIPGGWYLGIAWMLSGLLLVIGHEKADNEGFGRRLLHVVRQGLTALGIVGALILVVLAVMASVDLLFDLSMSDKLFSYPVLFITLVILPLLCCFLLSEEEGKDNDKRFLQILIDYVLSPALVLYTLILYGYIIRILVNWKLPDGGVGYMVLAYLGAGLLCDLLRLQISHRHFDWFFRVFPFLAIAPVILLWVGTLRRIGDYGITEDRFYLLVLCVLSSLFLVMLLWKRTGSYRLMAIILGVAAALFTYCPGIRAHDFGIRSQLARFDELLPKLLEDGHFPDAYDYQAIGQDEALRESLLTASGIWHYLQREMPSGALEKRYEAYGGSFLFNEWNVEQRVASEVKSVWTASRPLSLDGYTQWLPASAYYYYEDREQGIFYRDQDRSDILLHCPIRERLDADDATAENVLLYRNDQYLAIFLEITDYGKDHSPSFTTCQVQLYCKPE